MKGTRVWAFLCCAVLLGAPAAAAQSTPGEGHANAPPLSIGATPDLPAQNAPAAVNLEASVLRVIKFSGSVQEALGQPRPAVVGITFALYKEQAGGAPLWLETKNVSLDRQGRYTALLGATSNGGLPLEVFSSGEARWLGIQVQGQAEQRVLLVSVPYALKAAEADSLSGRTASDFVLSEHLSAQVEEEINSQIESQGLVTTEEAGTLAQVDGSGTTDQIAKFTSATTVGNSVITEKNGRVGINFASPVQFLVIGGTGGRMLNVSNLANQDLEIRVSPRLSADRFALIAPTTNTNLALGVGGQEKMRITNAGNVGIGTTTPSERLQVEGNVKATGNLTATTLSELSSRRWKENIEPLDESLGKVLQLQGVSYDRKADGVHDIGFIAEEVGEVVPEVVLWEETGEAQSLNYGRLTALLVEAVKEQQTQIRALQEELAKIKAGQATPAGQR